MDKHQLKMLVQLDSIKHCFLEKKVAFMENGNKKLCNNLSYQSQEANLKLNELLMNEVALHSKCYACNIEYDLKNADRFVELKRRSIYSGEKSIHWKMYKPRF